ncbi:PD-(D/E)XK nuclease family protein [Nocardioides sp. zg-ZUI104]|uniref:PD-(D/E)XK nuclease family protein n=1 Tax=Nocardioides faecalis TaxID=2803858 RepID=UPI001BCB5383|nr:PD-(D/E)XK nuclease family protein [Nocardioides faecalis]MBS4754237.1 PD-(D/E)XK nuclease family protein [Nocardioides faecalis]
MTPAPPLGGYPAKRCPRVTHNKYSPDAPPEPEQNEAVKEKLAKGRELEAVVFSRLDAVPGCVRVSSELEWTAAIEETMQLIADGADLILDGRLPDAGGRSGAPDVLVRVPGGYLPVDVKNHQTVAASRKQTVLLSTASAPAARFEVAGLSNKGGRWEDDAFQLAHYNRMLEDLGLHPGDGHWGGIIGTSDLAAQTGGEVAITWYDLDELTVQTYSASAADNRAKRNLMERYDHEFGFRRKVAGAALNGGELVRPLGTAECGECPWLSYCKEVAGDDDPSFAITAGQLNTRQWLFLREHGGDTLDGLASLDVDAVADEFVAQSARSQSPRKRLEDVVRRARMTLDGVHFEPVTSWADVEIPTADVEIDFDIEWDNDRHIYQWGVYVRHDQDDATGHYYEELLTLDPLDAAGEEALARQFAGLIDGLFAKADAEGKTAKIYHWSHPEKSETRKFSFVADALEGRTCDLRKWYSDNFFALGGAGLKNVAPLFDFEWDVEMAGGANSLAMIEQARKDGPGSAAAEWVLKYNTSDVKAQAAIRDGLRAARADALGEPLPVRRPAAPITSAASSAAGLDEKPFPGFAAASAKLAELAVHPGIRSALTKVPNVWKIAAYRSTSYETRYSRFFAWLLNPRETHKLGTWPMELLLDYMKDQSYVPMVVGADGEPTTFDDEGDLAPDERSEHPVAARTQVKPEHTNRHLDGFMDIWAIDHAHRWALAIEAKMGAVLSHNQLEKYEAATNGEIADNGGGYTRFLMTYSPQDLQGVKDGWLQVTYEQLHPLLDQVIDRANRSAEEARGAGDVDAEHHWRTVAFLVQQWKEDQNTLTFPVGDVLTEHVLTSPGLPTALASYLANRELESDPEAAFKLEPGTSPAFIEAVAEAQAIGFEENATRAAALEEAVQALEVTPSVLGQLVDLCWSERPTGKVERTSADVAKQLVGPLITAIAARLSVDPELAAGDLAAPTDELKALGLTRVVRTGGRGMGLRLYLRDAEKPSEQTSQPQLYLSAGGGEPMFPNDLLQYYHPEGYARAGLLLPPRRVRDLYNADDTISPATIDGIVDAVRALLSHIRAVHSDPLPGRTDAERIWHACSNTCLFEHGWANPPRSPKE